MNELNDAQRKKCVLITGATAGIGKATAYKFAGLGYKLILTARREGLLNEIVNDLREKFNSDIQTLVMDISKVEQIEPILATLEPPFKTIDILVNNAGLALGTAPFHEGEFSEWEMMVDTNLKGLLKISRIISAQMVKQGFGHIINLSSISGTQVYAGGNVYCATKHAVHAITKAMRIDLLKYGIRVSSISPGAVNTDFSTVRFKGDKSKANDVYAGYDYIVAEDVAETIVFVATRAKNININDIEITPTAQANAYYLHRQHKEV